MPLFFNPEDGKLWEQLQKLPPEKRAETVKKALYEFFQTHSEIQTENIISSELASLSNPLSPELSLHSKAEGRKEGSVVNCGELVLNDEEDLSLGSVTENELSLESLFEASPQEIKQDPLKNLLSVIGEEDDEEVLRLLLSEQKCKTEDKIETELKESVLSNEKNEVSLRQETAVVSGGLAYLLHNVIGEEEDEEVLHFFQNIAEKKEE